MEIFNDNTEVQTENKPSGSSLESLLSEYGQAAEITEIKGSGNTSNLSGQQTSNGNNTNPLQPGNNQMGATGSTSWQGNPLFYQTGKKVGQLRPKGPKVTYNPSTSPASISGELITGAMFLSLIDLAFPMLIQMVHNYFAKKKEDQIKWSDVSLTAEQRKQLSPVADQVVKQIVLTWNPTAILFFSMAGLYAMQYAIARMEQSLKKPK